MNEYRKIQTVLRNDSVLRQVWPEGMVAVRAYHGRKVFDLDEGRMVENGVIYSLDLSGLHASVLEQLAVLMSSRWGWAYPQALELLVADREFPIDEEHFAGTIFNGSEL